MEFVQKVVLVGLKAAFAMVCVAVLLFSVEWGHRWQAGELVEAIGPGLVPVQTISTTTGADGKVAVAFFEVEDERGQKHRLEVCASHPDFRAVLNDAVGRPATTTGFYPRPIVQIRLRTAPVADTHKALGIFNLWIFNRHMGAERYLMFDRVEVPLVQ